MRLSYIIKDLEVISTTYRKDLGLNFNKYPAFANLLKTRMKGKSFTADRMDISIVSREIKKYSYMPTPDHKYLIELSIKINENYPVLKDIDILTVTKNLINKYKSVEDISIYKFNKDGSKVGQMKQSTSASPLDRHITEDKKTIIQDVLRTNKTKIKNTPELKNKYIPYLTYKKNGDFDWWNSYVVELSYNTNLIKNKILYHKNLFVFNTLLFTAIFIAFIIITIIYFRKTEYMVNYDHLTNLPNRKLLSVQTNKYLNGKRQNKNKIAILFLDLDNFKNINDNYGHKTGDLILKKFASKLKNSLRKNDIISRIGGDEFVIILKNINTKKETIKVLEKIIELFNEPFDIDGQEITVSLSIGVSFYPDHGQEMQDLVKKADSAMYKAKKN